MCYFLSKTCAQKSHDVPQASDVAFRLLLRLLGLPSGTMAVLSHPPIQSRVASWR